MINIRPKKNIFEKQNNVAIYSDPAGRESGNKKTFYMVSVDGRNHGSPMDAPRSPQLQKAANHSSLWKVLAGRVSYCRAPPFLTEYHFIC